MQRKLTEPQPARQNPSERIFNLQKFFLSKLEPRVKTFNICSTALADTSINKLLASKVRDCAIIIRRGALKPERGALS